MADILIKNSSKVQLFWNMTGKNRKKKKKLHVTELVEVWIGQFCTWIWTPFSCR